MMPSVQKKVIVSNMVSENQARETSQEILQKTPHLKEEKVKLKVSGIIDESIVDGPGLRLTVFTQGCPHHCPGCHNPQTHDFDGGYWMNIEDIYEQCLENPLLSGVTFSGGEPFCQPAALYALGCKIKNAGLGLNLMVYTGYTYAQLKEMSKENQDIADLLSITDILVDGPYIEALRNLELKYRGSSNQNIIILNSSLDNLIDLN